MREFEGARYSSHEIREEHRDRAIEHLRKVEHSLDVLMRREHNIYLPYILLLLISRSMT